MTFPITPKNGEVFEHVNGYVYEYNAEYRTWEKTELTQLKTISARVSSKPPLPLKEPSPTLDVTPTIMEVINNELS